MKNTLLLLLLSVLIPFNFASAKSTYKGLPPSCESFLTKFARYNGAKTVKENVDWREVRENMKELGYSSRVAGDKLKEIDIDKTAMLQRVRNNTGNQEWTWRDNFTLKMNRAFGAAEGQSYQSYQFLSELPFWASLKGFNIPLIVNSLLKTKQHLGDTDQKFLSFYAPLWMEGALALPNAKLFYELAGGGENNVATKWLSWNLPERIRPQLTRFLQQKIRSEYRHRDSGEDEAWDDLKVTAALPWNRMPANLKRHLEGRWLDLETYRPITLDTIHHISRGYHDAGNCEYMANGHMKSLGLAERQDCSKDFNDYDGHKDSVLIEVNGHLVGSLKRLGDHSMVALRNVFDSSGRLVLAMGGVYHIGQGIYDKLPSRSRNGRWPRVNLDQLLVHPHTFLLNDNGWEGDINTGLLLRVGLDQFSKEELVQMFDESDGYNSSPSIDSEKRPAIWEGLLANIDRVRREQER